MADKIHYNGSDKWKIKATELLNDSASGGNVDDVMVDGVSVVDANKVAQIDLTPYAETADLATVATTGDYDDLLNKPTIPAAQVQSDWLESDTTAKSYILNKPNLAPVATSGSYADLSNKPALGTAAALDVAASGNASTTQVVKGNDTRLTDEKVLQEPTDDYDSSEYPLLLSNSTNKTTANTGKVQKAKRITCDGDGIIIRDSQNHTMTYGATEIYNGGIGVWETLADKADSSDVATDLGQKADKDASNIDVNDFLSKLKIATTPDIVEDCLTTSTAESVASNTYATIMQVTLSKGVWHISATAMFEANATGYRQAYITDSASSTSALSSMMATANAVDGRITALNFGRAIAITASTTIYLRVRHSSGSALDVYGRLTAVRLNATE